MVFFFKEKPKEDIYIYCILREIHQEIEQPLTSRKGTRKDLARGKQLFDFMKRREIVYLFITLSTDYSVLLIC